MVEEGGGVPAKRVELCKNRMAFEFVLAMWTPSALVRRGGSLRRVWLLDLRCPSPRCYPSSGIRLADVGLHLVSVAELAWCSRGPCLDCCRGPGRDPDLDRGPARGRGLDLGRDPCLSRSRRLGLARWTGGCGVLRLTGRSGVSPLCCASCPSACASPRRGPATRKTALMWLRGPFARPDRLRRVLSRQRGVLPALRLSAARRLGGLH